MTTMTPCRACGVVSEVEIRKTPTAEYYYAKHDCQGSWCKSADAAAAEWNAANTAPDPALLALATFGAMVVGWKFIDGMGFDTMQGGDLDEEGKRSGVLDGDFCVVLAPGIAEAIAALLAPDAGEVIP